MKTRLLKKLRRKAAREYSVSIISPGDYVVYTRHSLVGFAYDTKEKAIIRCEQKRRDWIIKYVYAHKYRRIY